MPCRKRKRLPFAITMVDIQELSIPTDVKEHAEAILNTMSPDVLRCMRKNCVLLYIVYFALKRARRYFGKEKLSNLFDIHTRSIPGIINEISMVSKNHGDKDLGESVVETLAEDLLDDICDNLPKFERCNIPAVKILIRRLVVKDPSLRDIAPQKLAASTLALFLEGRSVMIDDDAFGKDIGIKGWVGALDMIRKVMVGPK